MAHSSLGLRACEGAACLVCNERVAVHLRLVAPPSSVQSRPLTQKLLTTCQRRSQPLSLTFCFLQLTHVAGVAVGGVMVNVLVAEHGGNPRRVAVLLTVVSLLPQ